MAALILSSEEQLTPPRLQELHDQCGKLLPAYARPRFLRIKDTMQLTSGTMKQKKVELVEEGFDPAKTKGEPLYVVDVDEKTYVPLDEDLFGRIRKGEIRF